MAGIPVVATARARLEVMTSADVPALAAILADPDVAKNITADASSPERCRLAAAARITRYATNWDEHGYGVWGIREADDTAASLGGLLGWCGFAAPHHGDDPEILYGLGPASWGRGLATEAASAAIDWLFSAHPAAGVTAMVFGRINPASAAVLARLGLEPNGRTAMPDFLPDRAFAGTVLDYEIWRLGHGATRDPEALLFQAPYRGGQFTSLGIRESVATEKAFQDAARARADCADVDRATLDRRVAEAFRRGLAEPYLDCYRLDREGWRRRA